MFPRGFFRRTELLLRKMILPATGLLVFLLVVALPAMAQHKTGPGTSPSMKLAQLPFDQSHLDQNVSDQDYVWEPTYFVEGATYRGFLRLRQRSGFVWQAGHFDNGVWVKPHWVPTHNRVDFIWEPGHRGPDGYWVFGQWRPVRRPGFIWMEG